MSEEKRIVSRDEFIKLFIGADEARQREIKRLLVTGEIRIGTDETKKSEGQQAEK